jgi:hypothetical protein
MTAFRKRASGGYSKPESIAETIFEAATDKSPRIVYLAGGDAIALRKKRDSMSDEDYLKMTILTSCDNPKILGIDDAEVVGD